MAKARPQGQPRKRRVNKAATEQASGPQRVLRRPIAFPIKKMDGWNYFNYFTEIEEYFWKKRGAHLLVSPLDWAVMEAWQKAGVPLEAALKGIDKAFESYQRSRRGAGKPLKNLAYCTDAVLEAADEQQESAAGSLPRTKKSAAAAAFSREELKAYFAKNVARLKRVAETYVQQHRELAERLDEIAKSVESSSQLLDAPGMLDLEDLERRLTVLDEKIQSLVTNHAPEETMLKVRREVDGQLALYRRKMKTAQLAMVEKQYVQKRLLEEFGLPRLSLFYMT
jgi:ABC-type transporter Mla subunit MlaD